MNDLLQTSLFSLLAKPSQVTTHEMESAYAVFVKDITHYQPEIDYKQVFRRLNIARIELVSLQALLQDEKGEKYAQKTVLYKNNSLS